MSMLVTLLFGEQKSGDNTGQMSLILAIVICLLNTKEVYYQKEVSFCLFLYRVTLSPSVCRFKSLSYYRHLAASPSFGRADSALQTMELPLDGDKYDSLLIFTVTGFFGKKSVFQLNSLIMDKLFEKLPKLSHWWDFFKPMKMLYSKSSIWSTIIFWVTEEFLIWEILVFVNKLNSLSTKPRDENYGYKNEHG